MSPPLPEISYVLELPGAWLPGSQSSILPFGFGPDLLLERSPLDRIKANRVQRNFPLLGSGRFSQGGSGHHSTMPWAFCFKSTYPSPISGSYALLRRCFGLARQQCLRHLEGYVADCSSAPP